MNKTALEVRIELLEGRNKENKAIIKKLQRKLRKISK